MLPLPRSSSSISSLSPGPLPKGPPAAQRLNSLPSPLNNTPGLQSKRSLSAFSPQLQASGASFGGGAASSGGSHPRLQQQGARPRLPDPRLFNRLSGGVQAEVLHLLLSVQGLKGEDFDEGVVYQLLAKSSEEEAVAALRALGALGPDQLTGMLHVPSYLAH
ncbi:uncharacterized protein HaLaN_02203, partial [Haematococcus lacustris]